MSDFAMKYAMKKRMAKGGMCKHNSMECPECHGGMMSEGGMADAKDEYDPMQHPMPVDNMAAEMEDEDMIGRIMNKRMVKMSEGGKVANKDEIVADLEPNEFDDLAKDDDLEFHDTGANSGDEVGDDQEDMDRRDVVSRIMRSRAKKDRMPRPA